MLFKKEILKELLWDEEYEDEKGDEYKTILNEINDTSRWSIHHKHIFSFKGKYYITYYSVGATEQQDESPYEYDDDMIECDEVEPYEETIIKYRVKK